MPNSPLPPLNPREWLAQRFIRVSESNPRFESSWYGLHIALLSHYFPYQQKFLIKPQPRVRDSYEEDVSFSSNQAEASFLANLEDTYHDSLAGDISITSTGVLVAPVSAYRIPDFTVTKATEFATHDKLLLLVEVKSREPNENDWAAFGVKMDEYMEAASQHLEKGAGLVGLLICGTVAEVSRLANPGAKIITDKKRYNVNSPPIRRLLHSLAKENWDP